MEGCQGSETLLEANRELKLLWAALSTTQVCVFNCAILGLDFSCSRASVASSVHLYNQAAEVANSRMLLFWRSGCRSSSLAKEKGLHCLQAESKLHSQGNTGLIQVAMLSSRCNLSESEKYLMFLLLLSKLSI